MKALKKISLLLSFVVLATVSAFAINTTKVAEAATLKGTATGYTKASDVVYKKTGNYVHNWGARGENCVFLTSYANDFYTGSYTFDQLSTKAGGTSYSTATNSALYKSLKELMSSKQTYQTSYSATRDLFRYTDCVNNNSSYISSFYSANQINGAWDGGSTWNREHTWPNSKGDNAGNGENDIMMLRPTATSENGSRGNKAYGESSGYYDPNGLGQNLRGDCARIVLYVYTRWGCTNTGSYNSNDIFGTGGVIESLNVLLKWMAEDPVDTWEMARNDAVQSITGTRNVFVDYPEYAWMLFGKEIPSNISTPSMIASNGTYVPPAGGGSDVEDSSSAPETPDDAATILNQLYALKDGESASGSYTVTGVITALDNYNNPTIVVDGITNKPVYCYKLKDDRFAVGQTITVTATTLKNHQGTYEFMNCTLVSIDETESSEMPDSSEEIESSEVELPESSEVLPPVTSGLQEGVAYTVSANNADGLLYLKGTITSGRFDCSTSAADAVYVYVENVAGGQLLYMNVNGTKTYFVFADKSAGGSTTTRASDATVFEWSAELQTLVVAEDANNRAFGAQPTSMYVNFSTYDANNAGYNWGKYTPVSSVPEIPEDSESSEETESSEVIESSEEIESGEVVESSEEIESSEVVESSEEIESSEVVESSEEVESSELVESSEVETPDISLSTDEPVSSEEIESSELPESSEDVESSELPASSELPESSEEIESSTVETPDVSESNDEPASSDAASSDATSIPASFVEDSSKTEGKESGCGSSIGGSMAILAVAAGVCLLMKKSKKED